jgi:alpha-D-ribose 1-methylphosphonate 5-triphosphate synthase subunit PhnI
VTTIEAGAPFAEVLAACEDAVTLLRRASAAEQRGNSDLANLELMQVEDALDRAMQMMLTEWSARYGCDDEVES